MGRSGDDLRCPGKMNPHIKPRRAWVAGLLSLLVPGLGQVYNGEPKKAGFYLALIALGTPVVLLLGSPAVIVAAYLVAVAIFLYLVFDAIAVARKSGSYVLKPYNKWYIYAGYAAAVFLIASFIQEHLV
jgi:signal peptidase I